MGMGIVSAWQSDSLTVEEKSEISEVWLSYFTEHQFINLAA